MKRWQNLRISSISRTTGSRSRFADIRIPEPLTAGKDRHAGMFRDEVYRQVCGKSFVKQRSARYETYALRILALLAHGATDPIAETASLRRYRVEQNFIRVGRRCVL
jgi:hypothetical protein